MGDETEVVGPRGSPATPTSRQVMHTVELEGFRAAVRAIHADRRVVNYAVRLADATRRPDRYEGLADLAPLIEVGASPRGPIGLIQAGQALAVLRGREHVTPRDVRDLARRPAPPPGALLRRPRRRRTADEISPACWRRVDATGAEEAA